MSDQKVITYDSPEAASIKTMTGWVASDGRFWGDDEHMARFCGSTHRVCPTNAAHGLVAHRSYCKACHAEKEEQKWQDMTKEPFTEDIFPLCVFGGDQYFFDIDDLTDWLEEHEIRPELVRLVKCTPNYPQTIDPEDQYIDVLPEDGDVPDEVAEAFRVLNDELKKCGPISWSAGAVGVLLPADLLESA
jgi:hypothetical protein